MKQQNNINRSFTKRTLTVLAIPVIVFLFIYTTIQFLGLSNDHNLQQQQQKLHSDRIIDHNHQNQQRMNNQEGNTIHNIDSFRDEFRRLNRNNNNNNNNKMADPIALYILPKFSTTATTTAVNQLEGNQELMTQYVNQWSSAIQEKLGVQGVTVKSVSPRKALLIVPAENSDKLEAIQKLLREMGNVEHTERKMSYHTMNNN